MNAVVRVELLNAIRDILRFVGPRRPVSHQTQRGTIGDRKNSGAFTRCLVIAKRMLLVKPIADDVRNPGREMAWEKGIQRIVLSFRITRAAGTEMRSQPGVQNSVKIAEILAFALFRVIVAISHVYRSIFACVP